MKKYLKPQTLTVAPPESLMGDINIGISSQPYPGKEDELPMSAKRHDFVPDWEDNDDLELQGTSFESLR